MGKAKLQRFVPAICIFLALAGCDGASTTPNSASSGGGAVTTAGLTISAVPVTTVAAGQEYALQPKVTAPAGHPVGYSIQNKPQWAAFSTATGTLQGAPSTADVGTYPNVLVSASDGTAVSSLPPFSITVTPSLSTTTTPGTASRPSYNTGNGFFVANGKLYDPNGNEFRIRGVNRNHWDSNSAAGIALSGANTVRWVIDFTRDAATNVAEIQTQGIANRNVPIVGNWTATCSTDPNALSAAVQTWISQAAQWTTLNKDLILNVANEWGPAGSTVWRDSYISAIASLRAAGYTGPILVDSGGCGQDQVDLIQYSQAVFDSDPERNVMFAEHLYGGTDDNSASIESIQKGNPTVITLASNSPTHPFAANYNGTNNSYSGFTSYQISGVQGMTQINGVQAASPNAGGVQGSWTVTLSVDSTNWPDYTGGGIMVDTGNYNYRIAEMAGLSQSTGAVYIIGEFGPGNNIGPSPTMVTPGEIISAAESNGIGWLAWAWDDNDLPNCMGDNNSFDMTYNCGAYAQPSDLTNYGQDVVLNPIYGITALAKPASIF